MYLILNTKLYFILLALLTNCKPSNVCLFPAKFYQYLLELRVTTSMQWQSMVEKCTAIWKCYRRCYTYFVVIFFSNKNTENKEENFWSILIEFLVFIVEIRTLYGGYTARWLHWNVSKNKKKITNTTNDINNI